MDLGFLRWEIQLPSGKFTTLFFLNIHPGFNVDSCPLSLCLWRGIFAIGILDYFLYLQTTILQRFLWCWRVFQSSLECWLTYQFKACGFLSKSSTMLLHHVLLWYHDFFYITSLKNDSGDAKWKRWRKLVYSQTPESALMLSLTLFPKDFYH